MDYAKAKNADADEEATWDSCYDAPTDDEAEFPLAFKSDKDLEGVQNEPTDDGGDVKVESAALKTEGLDAPELYVSKKAKYATAKAADTSDDEDSVDYVLRFDERYLDDGGTIAFCCQNCQ
jgi:hypothetical protein